VDVRLLLPGVSDAPLVIMASRADYQSLLESGVRIYERTGTTLHAKSMVIDGVWSTIGSANLDYRSFLHNHEVNAVVVDPAFGHAMERLFESDLQQAEEISLSTWSKRPLIQRIKEMMGSALRYWF
jgi:cardiolipin synthase